MLIRALMSINFQRPRVRATVDFPAQPVFKSIAIVFADFCTCGLLIHFAGHFQFFFTQEYTLCSI